MGGSKDGNDASLGVTNGTRSRKNSDSLVSNLRKSQSFSSSFSQLRKGSIFSSGDKSNKSQKNLIEATETNTDSSLIKRVPLKDNSSKQGSESVSSLKSLESATKGRTSSSKMESAISKIKSPLVSPNTQRKSKKHADSSSTTQDVEETTQDMNSPLQNRKRSLSGPVLSTFLERKNSVQYMKVVPSSKKDPPPAIITLGSRNALLKESDEDVTDEEEDERDVLIEHQIDPTVFKYQTRVSISHKVQTTREGEFTNIEESSIYGKLFNELDTSIEFTKSILTGHRIARTYGLYTVHLYSDDETCHKLCVTPQTTLHEMRMEVLASYGFVPLIEDSEIYLVENGSKETLVQPNCPLDYYLPAEEDIIDDQIITFKLKKRPPVWNITVEVNSEKRHRFLLVGVHTQVREVLETLYCIEGINDETRERFGLYRESAEIDGRRISRFLEKDEKPFDFSEFAKYTLLDYNDISKRHAKLTNILGENNMNQIISQELDAAEDLKRRNEALRSVKLTHWFGFNVEQEKSKGKAKAKSAMDLGTTVDAMASKGRSFFSRHASTEIASNDAHIIPGSKAGSRVGSRAGSKAASRAGSRVGSRVTSPLSPLEQISNSEFEVSMGRKIAAAAAANNNNGNGSNTNNGDSYDVLHELPEARPRPLSTVSKNNTVSVDSVMSTIDDGLLLQKEARKTSKLMNIFGVKAGEKDMTVISNLSRDRRSLRRKKKSPSASNNNTFLVRIYFVNFTFTCLSLPMNAKPEVAINHICQKFHIYDELDTYRICLYHQQSGVTEDIDENAKLFDIMVKWEQDETFLFTKMSSSSKLGLRAHDVSIPPTPQTAPEETSSPQYETANSQKDPAKKVGKLTDFFGLKSKFKNAKISEMEDIQDMISEINHEIIITGASSQDIYKDGGVNSHGSVPLTSSTGASPSPIFFDFFKVESVCKKGELFMFDTKTKQWNETLVSMENNIMTVRYNNTTTQQQEEKQEILCIAICPELPLETNFVKEGKSAFSIVDEKTIDTYIFSAKNDEEKEDWVSKINSGKYASDTLRLRKRLSLASTGATNNEQQTIEQGIISRLSRRGTAIPRGASIAECHDQGIDGSSTDLLSSLENDNVRVYGDISNSDDIPPQDELIKPSDFELHKLIGRGKFAKVLLISQKTTKQVYAMKVVRKDGDEDTEAELVCNESRILHNLMHPFIVSLLCSFHSDERLYMILEYVAGGELFFHISNFGRFTEERCRFYGAEILLALEYLHSKEIIYRDLKLENILLGRDGHIKLTDFGLSKVLAGVTKSSHSINEDRNKIVGTLEYLAPEVLLGESASYLADWWAFGVVMFEMLCGYHPFYSDERQYIHQFIFSAPIEFPEHVSDDASSLGVKLLARNQNHRLGKRGGKEIRSHKFFKNIDFVKLFNKEVEVPFEPETIDDFDVRFFDEVFTEEAFTPVDSAEDILLMNN